MKPTEYLYRIEYSRKRKQDILIYKIYRSRKWLWNKRVYKAYSFTFVPDPDEEARKYLAIYLSNEAHRQQMIQRSLDHGNYSSIGVIE
jgi:hypothetical protein